MSETCEFLEKCGFFLNYKGNTEVVQRGWVKLYCEDGAKSAQCERKKIRERTGAPPVDSLSPEGWLLS